MSGLHFVWQFCIHSHDPTLHYDMCRFLTGAQARPAMTGPFAMTGLTSIFAFSSCVSYVSEARALFNSLTVCIF